MNRMHHAALVAVLILAAVGCKKEEPAPAATAEGEATPTIEAPKAPEPAKAPEAAPAPAPALENAPAPAPAAAPPAEGAPGGPGVAAAPAGSDNPALRDPSKATAKAPDKYKVKMHTTKGDFVIEVTRDWSPGGADRLFNMVRIGYFKDVAFFRAVQDFMVQFGIHGDPTVNAVWRNAPIADDPPGKASNVRGNVTFAKTGRPDSRSVQLFINYKDNVQLDGMGFTPIGKIASGMDVVDKLNQEYGEAPSAEQMRIQTEGNRFLKATFPKLDYIIDATIVP